jgi:hypothetical protein
MLECFAVEAKQKTGKTPSKRSSFSYRTFSATIIRKRAEIPELQEFPEKFGNPIKNF